MNDQGEKIVFLAREILNAGVAETADLTRHTGTKKLYVTMSFKTLCLTTLLAAAGGGLVTGWSYASEKPLTRYEKTEIEALILYAAQTKGLDEETLRRAVAQKVGAARIEDMTSGEFPTARRYLQEQVE